MWFDNLPDARCVARIGKETHISSDSLARQFYLFNVQLQAKGRQYILIYKGRALPKQCLSQDFLSEGQSRFLGKLTITENTSPPWLPAHRLFPSLKLPEQFTVVMFDPSPCGRVGAEAGRSL